MSAEGRTGVAIPVPAAGQLDHRTIGALSELFAAQRPIPVTFAECCRNSGFVYLRPDPIDALTELADRLRRRRPGLTPPEGRDGEVGPHLTVAMRASEQTAEAIERETVAALPIPAVLAEAWLVVFVDGRWVLRERFEFSSAARPEVTRRVPPPAWREDR